jgi:dTDP-L-rhamnose 4-epimerase
VTGGAGFIGTALCKRLVAEGYVVSVLDSFEERVHPSGSPRVAPVDGVELRVGDVRDPADWDRVLSDARPEMIVHLAAETATGLSLLEVSRQTAANAGGVAEMLDAFSRNAMKPAHILLASSRAVYGEGAWRCGERVFYPGPRTAQDLRAGRWNASYEGQAAEPLPHDARLTQARPTNVYAATKLAQEHLAGAWCAAMDVPLTVLRFQNVYGPGQSLTNPYTGVALLFAAVAGRGGTIEVYEDGHIIRDFVHVEDVVEAMVLSLARPTVHRLLDIGSGEPITLLQLAADLARRTSAPPPIVSGAFREGDVRAACACIEDAQDFGWQPTHSLSSDLDELLEYAASTTGQG